MSLVDKYQPVINLLNILQCKNLKIYEKDGSLNIYCVVNDPHDRRLLLEKINQVNSENAIDINYYFEIK
jgi:hypothetical protein